MLRLGDQEVIVVEVGGGLRRYTVGGVDVLDGYDHGELPPGSRGAVLAPWCNRIRDGRYSFEGHDQQLEISEPATNCALHGYFHWLPFVAEEVGAAYVVLSAVLPARKGYPFTIRLRTRYSLGPGGLTATHAAHNLGPGPAPFSFATHCYLAAGSAVDTLTLHVPATTYLPTDERLLPLAAASVEGTPNDFRTPRVFGSTVLDTAFTGLTRDPDGLVRTTITGLDGRTVQIWGDASFDWLQVFSSDTLVGPLFRRAFAVEPMTSPPDAFNSGTDLLVIPPAGTWTGTWGITARGLPAADAPARAAFLRQNLVPDQTADDEVDAVDRAGRGGSDDDRIRREVPPHHGG